MKPEVQYKSWYPLLRWVLGLLSLAYLAVHWGDWARRDAKTVWRLVEDQPLLIGSVVLLMLLNYGMESEKFRTLLSAPIQLARGRSLLVVFSGVTISNFTPAKTGEYVGRSVLLPNFPALRVVLATVTGNLLQLFWTYAFGIVAFGILAGSGHLPEGFAQYRWEIGLALVIVFLGGLLIRYLPSLQRPLSSYVPDGWRESLEMLGNYRGPIIQRSLTYSFIRYLIFAGQYVLLLQTLSGNALPMYAVLYIPMIYLMQSLVPVPSAVDVGFRLYFAKFFFAPLVDEGVLSYAVIGIWLINLIIPAVIGAFYMLYSLKQK